MVYWYLMYLLHYHITLKSEVGPGDSGGDLHWLYIATMSNLQLYWGQLRLHNPQYGRLCVEVGA